MRFTYRLIRDHHTVVAECLESEAAGEGKTAKEAVESLRRSLEERMFRPDAVAPPPSATECVIELVLAEEGTAADRRSLDPSGPGDAPLR
jgi:hypothetical protein